MEKIFHKGFYKVSKNHCQALTFKSMPQIFWLNECWWDKMGNLAKEISHENKLKCREDNWYTRKLQQRKLFYSLLSIKWDGNMLNFMNYCIESNERNRKDPRTKGRRKKNPFLCFKSQKAFCFLSLQHYVLQRRKMYKFYLIISLPYFHFFFFR